MRYTQTPNSPVLRSKGVLGIQHPHEIAKRLRFHEFGGGMGYFNVSVARSFPQARRYCRDAPSRYPGMCDHTLEEEMTFVNVLNQMNRSRRSITGDQPGR